MYRNPINLTQVGVGAGEGSSCNCRPCIETITPHQVCVCGGTGMVALCTSSLVAACTDIYQLQYYYT